MSGLSAWRVASARRGRFSDPHDSASGAAPGSAVFSCPLRAQACGGTGALAGAGAALWTFVQVEGVEPTNNAAERAIRPGVLWRKSRFGTPSENGSRFVECMLTVVATLQQQQRNILAYLTTACEAALRGEAPPALLPVSDQESQAAA